MYFLIEDNDLVDKRNNILDKTSAFKKEFYREPVHNKRHLKTIIKSYGDEITDFCDK